MHLSYKKWYKWSAKLLLSECITSLDYLTATQCHRNGCLEFITLTLWSFQLLFFFFVSLPDHYCQAPAGRGLLCVSSSKISEVVNNLIFVHVWLWSALFDDWSLTYSLSAGSTWINTCNVIEKKNSQGFVTCGHFVPSLHSRKRKIFMALSDSSLSRKQMGKNFLWSVSVPAPQSNKVWMTNFVLFFLFFYFLSLCIYCVNVFVNSD